MTNLLEVTRKYHMYVVMVDTFEGFGLKVLDAREAFPLSARL